MVASSTVTVKETPSQSTPPKPLKYFDTNAESTKTLNAEDYNTETPNYSEFTDEQFDFRSKTPLTISSTPEYPSTPVSTKRTVKSQVMDMFNKYATPCQNDGQSHPEEEPPIIDDHNLVRKFSFLTRSATAASSTTINTNKTNKTCPADVSNKTNGYNKSQEVTDNEYESEYELEPNRRAPLVLNSKNGNYGNYLSAPNNETKQLFQQQQQQQQQINNNIYNQQLQNNNIYNNQQTVVKNFGSYYPTKVGEPIVEPAKNEISEHLINIEKLKYLLSQNNTKIMEIEMKKSDKINKKLDDVYNDVPLDVTELLKLNTEMEAAEAVRIELEERIEHEKQLEQKRIAIETAKKRENEWNVYKNVSLSRSAVRLANNSTPQQFTTTTNTTNDVYTREKLIDYYDNIQIHEDNVSMASNISTVSAMQAAEIMRKVVPIVNNVAKTKTEIKQQQKQQDYFFNETIHSDIILNNNNNFNTLNTDYYEENFVDINEFESPNKSETQYNNDLIK